MQRTSWLGSVWSLRGDDRRVIGQVRSVEGDRVTLAVVGLGQSPPDGLAVLPPDGSGGTLARVSAGTLVGRWRRMGAEGSAPG